MTDRSDVRALKIVYYGAGLGGKTENFVALKRAVPGATLTSYANKTDRRLRLDLALPLVDGSHLPVALHTEPG